MLIICLLLAVGFAVWMTRVRIEVVKGMRAALIAEAAKELGAWDRVKELGFNDVLVWEAAFKEATGALPEGSRTKELEAKHKADMEAQMQLMNNVVGIRTGHYATHAHPYPYENSFEYERRVGAPIRYGW